MGRLGGKNLCSGRGLCCAGEQETQTPRRNITLLWLEVFCFQAVLMYKEVYAHLLLF